MANGLFNLKQVMQGIQQSSWNGQKPPAVEYLVVAGGGGGGRGGGGGGGAGGLLQGIAPVPNGQSLIVTVGSGGAQGSSYGASGTSGQNSVFNNITSTGGGGGAGYYTVGGGKSGGSGGGGADDYYVSTYPTAFLQGQGILGQGNAGGGFSPSGACASGGGGAGTTGVIGIGGNGGNGGAGIASAINGTVATYAGGGGGGGGSGAGTGGAGGGGNGGYSSAGVPTAGTSNTGGGGGGDWNDISVAGSGGSGIVIVSYPDTYAAPTATTGGPTVSTSGSGSLLTTGTTYLRYAGQTPFAFGSGDFTMECWVYRPAGAVLGILWDFRQTSTNGAYPYLFKDTDNLLYYYVNSASRIVSSVGLTANAWSHVAVCRSGTTTTMYINGASVGSYTDTTTYLVGSTGPALFADNTNLYTFTGNISNLRFVKGVCVYTGAFTPPTGPLQATQSAGTNIAAITGTQTSLLLNTVSGAWCADSSTNGYAPSSPSIAPPWNASSPFTVTGYKNRVYTWTSSGSITF